ncbi:CRE-AQP-4 protein [Aphelenchoides avenae]|nr:CRE-AQP-4 protein [Aphelenchus avenae]
MVGVTVRTFVEDKPDPLVHSFQLNPQCHMVWSKEVSVSPDVPSISGVYGRKYSLLHKLAAEFVGDTIFVFIGALSALKSVDENNVTHAAFAHGLTIFVLVASLGHISGGHFNPAVTLSATLAGKFRPLYLVPYWIAQLGGGFVGALLVRAVTGKLQYERLQGGATLLSPGEEWYQGLIVETILTMILTQTILMTAVDTEENLLAPLAIGLTLTLDIFGAGSITGASMNPARSFGPSLAATIFSDSKNMWDYHYIYWAGPFLGASISALLYRTLFARHEFH